MREYYPVLIVAAFISLTAIAFLIAFLFVKGKKEAFGFERNMRDSELIRRLFA